MSNQGLEKLEKYYEINQNHAKWSFWASLIAVGVGLVTVIAGIVLLYIKNSSDYGLITSASGVLTEFIAGGFFYLYNRNLKQLNLFYEKLVKLQDTMLAISIIAHQMPGGEKSEAYKLLVGMLVTRNEPKTTEVTPELIKAISDAEQAKRKK